MTYKGCEEEYNVQKRNIGSNIIFPDNIKATFGIEILGKKIKIKLYRGCVEEFNVNKKEYGRQYHLLR